jgi:hypothetical protein
MQEENELPAVEDTLGYRNQFAIGLFSKNRKIDAGCQSWESPDGHIFLCFLATPVKVRSDITPDSNQASKSSEPSGSELDTESQLDTTKDEGATNSEECTTTIDKVVQAEVAEPSSTSSTTQQGYSLSGLILGPVNGSAHSNDLKYERLARFTSIGVVIKDNRDLAKLNRKISIV